MALLRILLLPLLLVGCASQPFHYSQTPTPLVQGQSQYFVGAVRIKLVNGPGGDPDNLDFADQQQLTRHFTALLKANLAKGNQLAARLADADAVLELDMEYVRHFNFGGRSLNKPEVSFSAYLLSPDHSLRPLADFRVARFTTRYPQPQDAEINAEIAAYRWDDKDEPRDLALIAQSIAEDLARVGD